MVRIAQAFAKPNKVQDPPEKIQLIKKSNERKLPKLPRVGTSATYTPVQLVKLEDSNKISPPPRKVSTSVSKKDYIKINKSDIWKLLALMAIIAVFWIILALSARVNRLEIDMNKLKLLLSQNNFRP